MKWFVIVNLKRAKLAETVYATSAKDAHSLAITKTREIAESWDDVVTDTDVYSYERLGILACAMDDSITYAGGDYYFFGRKVNNDINFINGFAHEYERQQKQDALENDNQTET